MGALPISIPRDFNNKNPQVKKTEKYKSLDYFQKKKKSNQEKKKKDKIKLWLV